MNYQEFIINKVKDKSAVISIIGLGYVGLPLMLRFVEEGYETLGIDVDQHKIDQLNDGTSYIEHISGDKIQGAIEKKCFRATSDFSEVSETQVIILCLPTPLRQVPGT